MIHACPQYCFLLAFFILLHETIQSEEIYKLIRPYKYYQRRPSRWPRFHAGHKSSRFYRFGRIPSEDYYSRRSTYYRKINEMLVRRFRYRSSRNDFDGRAENHPYTIVIQLPKAETKYRDNNYRERQRNYERDAVPTYNNESDYIDEEEEMESKVGNINNKKVQIKMIKGKNPKLHIQISKSDNENNLEIVDKSSISSMNLPRLFNYKTII
nr:uncharacterized protein LOC117609008 [Osmia lignaria]